MAQFLAREHHRFRRSVPVCYLGVSIAGDGLIDDLSLSGCRIHGNTTVSLGMPLALLMFVPSDPDPLRIERVIVKWVKGSEFGVEFRELQRKVADRICMTISRSFQREYGDFPSR